MLNCFVVSSYVGIAWQFIYIWLSSIQHLWFIICRHSHALLALAARVLHVPVLERTYFDACVRNEEMRTAPQNALDGRETKRQPRTDKIH